MQKLEVFGPNKLKGQVNISGSKNASLPILAASLLSTKKVYLNNTNNIRVANITLTHPKGLGEPLSSSNRSVV